MSKIRKSTERRPLRRGKNHRILCFFKAGLIAHVATISLLTTASFGTQDKLSIGDIRTRLSNCNREGGDTNINGRINSLGTILNMSGVFDTFTLYKLQQLSELIGDANGPDTSLYKLYKSPANATEELGYPGSFPGEVTPHGRLNRIMEIILQSTILVQFGEASDTPLEAGKTLWSRLNWVAQHETFLQNEGFQKELKEAIKQMKTLQACLHGAVGLIDALTMETLLGKTSSPSSVGTLTQMNTVLTALQKEINQSATGTEDENATEAISKITEFQGILQTTYKAIAKKVGEIEIAKPTFSGNFSQPIRFSESVQTVQDLLNKLKSNDPQDSVLLLDLTPIVRELTYNWPFLMKKIETAETDIIKNIHAGTFIGPGLTLLNCLNSITKTINLNEVIKKIGNPNTDEESTTLWEAIQQQKGEAEENASEGIEAAEEALTLVRRLLENMPALGEVITNSTTLTAALNNIIDSGDDAKTKALALRAKINDYCMAFLPTSIARPNNTEQTLFPYETLFALLLNNPTPLSEEFYPAIRTALYATPLVYEIEGTTLPIPKTALIAKLASVSGGGSINDFWGNLVEPTACSIIKALSQVIAKSGEMMQLEVQDKTLADTCQANLQTIVSNSEAAIDRLEFYDKMSSPFRQLINNVLGNPSDMSNGTNSSGLYKEAETALNQDSSLLKTFQDKLKQLQDALNYGYTQAYPVDFSAVYTNLTQAQKALSTQVGHATDHFLDVTAFGRVNGALFESGAKLILNLIGKISDPGQPNYGTLQAKLREIELSEGSNAEEIKNVRTKVNSLQGRIRSAFLTCLVSPENDAPFTTLVNNLYSSNAPKWNSWTATNFVSQSTFLDTCLSLLTPTTMEGGK